MKKTHLKIFSSLFLINLIFILSFKDNHVYAANDSYPCPNLVDLATTVGQAPCYEVNQGQMVCVDYVPATCTSAGYKKYQCSACGNSETKTIDAKGHNLSVIDSKEATCLEAGYKSSYCTTCKESFKEEYAALGHNYQEKQLTKVSCETAGLSEFACSRCSDSYQKEIEALGHNYQEIEIVEATCLEAGYLLSKCQNCGLENKQDFPALNHDVEYKITKQASCIQPGNKAGLCKNCGEEINETIPATGHDYPQDWTIDKKASYFKDGSQSKECLICKNRIKEVIPKKEVPLSLSITAATSALAAASLFILKKAGKLGAKKVTKKILEENSKEIIEEVSKEALEPSFETKTIIVSMKEDSLYKAMKAQKYLEVVESDYEELQEAINENEPSLCLIDIGELSLQDVKEKIKNIHSENQDATFTLLVSEQQFKDNKEDLQKLKEAELIKDYALVTNNYNVNLVKLILPVMKPDLKSDEGLENLGMVADTLNIPFVSTLLSAYSSGREIKETIQDSQGELGVVDKAIIISALASILGLEKVSSVAGLVEDVDDIKSSVEAKFGGSQANTIKDAAMDIIEVVSDIKDN